MKIIILGAGLVGKHIAIDLAKDFEVCIADINENVLKAIAENYAITTAQQDLSDADALKKLISNYDLVLNAVPGFMGLSTLKSIIEAGKDVVEIAFSPEDVMTLDTLAKQHNVTAICDMGVAPGMSNVLVGYADHLLDETTDVKIYVGGLPQKREWPFEYKAPFSPIDVIEEYTRPARVVENGKIVIKEALSEVELMNFDPVGTLEAFNSDGLRSLVNTIDAPNMIEKTLRYSGHTEIMKIFRATGFFSQEEIEIQGVKIKAIDFTAKLLFPKWKLAADEPEFTLMKIIVEGLKDGKNTRYTYDLFDTYDEHTQTHSMARTTGYAATAAVRMFAKGLYTKKGVTVPEIIGKDEKCVQFLLKELKKRNIEYKECIENY